MSSVTRDREEEFDWQRIHRRLEASWSTLVQKVSPDATARQHVLRERAKALARTPEHNHVAGNTVEIVEFLLANEHYAVESLYVQEVCPLKNLRPLPGAPPFVLGLINVRAQILSV